MSDASVSRPLTRLRNYFLTGMIVTAPLVITIYLIWSFVKWVDGWVIPYVPNVYNPSTYLPYQIPGIGLIIGMFVITAIGFLTANIIGRTAISYGEEFVGRMPVVRNLYKAIKQIFQTALSKEVFAFQKVGLIEFPSKGLWSMVFVVTESKAEIGLRLDRMGHDTICVMLPLAPNPISSFLIYVRRQDLILLDMSVEEGIKMVISAGLVMPAYDEKLAALAREAKAKEEIPSSLKQRAAPKSVKTF